jgi:hypothetical protein
MYMWGQAEAVVKDSDVGEEEMGQVTEDEKLRHPKAEVAAVSLAGIAKAYRGCALVLEHTPWRRHSALYTSR